MSQHLKIETMWFNWDKEVLWQVIHHQTRELFTSEKTFSPAKLPDSGTQVRKGPGMGQCRHQVCDTPTVKPAAPDRYRDHEVCCDPNLLRPSQHDQWEFTRKHPVWTQQKMDRRHDASCVNLAWRSDATHDAWRIPRETGKQARWTKFLLIVWWDMKCLCISFGGVYVCGEVCVNDTCVIFEVCQSLIRLITLRTLFFVRLIGQFLSVRKLPQDKFSVTFVPTTNASVDQTNTGEQWRASREKGCRGLC